MDFAKLSFMQKHHVDLTPEKVEVSLLRRINIKELDSDEPVQPPLDLRDSK